MIWSVSTLLRRSGTPIPVCVVNFSIVSSLAVSAGQTLLIESSAGSDVHRHARVQRGQRAAVEGGQVGVLGQVQIRHRGERAAYGGGGGDQRGDQVGAPALALPALEVAVRGRGGPLPRCELVRVHAQAHRAAGV